MVTDNPMGTQSSGRRWIFLVDTNIPTVQVDSTCTTKKPQLTIMTAGERPLGSATAITAQGGKLFLVKRITQQQPVGSYTEAKRIWGRSGRSVSELL
ncbi:hypothetical protein GDO86_004125 [Hymenochirus boettgeri]|uniref:Methionyl-tRNA formyltransferase n=1 Tax=Hymenochirus boettgeri TaxID=247094 RepID=A0A8T2K6N1_9PIPI|nr:hypothetical protein GDO86_004125 [Hymenochirus boettgeri]